MCTAFCAYMYMCMRLLLWRWLKPCFFSLRCAVGSPSRELRNPVVAASGLLGIDVIGTTFALFSLRWLRHIFLVLVRLWRGRGREGGRKRGREIAPHIYADASVAHISHTVCTEKG